MINIVKLLMNDVFVYSLLKIALDVPLSDLFGLLICFGSSLSSLKFFPLENLSTSSVAQFYQLAGEFLVLDKQEIQIRIVNKKIIINK